MLLLRYFGVRQQPQWHEQQGRAAHRARAQDQPSYILWGGMTWETPRTFLCGLHRTCPGCKARMHSCSWHLPRRCCFLCNEFSVPCSPRATYQV